jgi:hypothetical protein
MSKPAPTKEATMDTAANIANYEANRLSKVYARKPKTELFTKAKAERIHRSFMDKFRNGATHADVVAAICTEYDITPEGFRTAFLMACRNAA